MFIIAESGSTKTDWVVLDQNQIEGTYHSAGINPAINRDFPDLSGTPGLGHALRRTESLYFYGAGVREPEHKRRLEDYFRSYGFSGRLYADGDMLAAARATCGEESGIVCILGTGSNSCVYDGKEIVSTIPSMGYILGDEGGGVHLGKEILRSYFYKTMPEDIAQKFRDKYGLSISDLIQNVYQGDAPNRYLASFSEFLSEIEGPWKTAMIEKVFNEFVVSRILCFNESKTLKVHFVGSIAFYFKEYLLNMLNLHKLNVGNIILKPVDLLVKYHINNKIYE